MNQIGFKGYAQSLGFDPIKAPDRASKELEQGKNEIRNMRSKSLRALIEKITLEHQR
jgi:hypothetical protein